MHSKERTRWACLARLDLAFTRYCNCQYCVVYIAITGGRGVTLHCAIVRAVTVWGGVPKQRVGAQRIVLIRAQRPRHKTLSYIGQDWTSRKSVMHIIFLTLLLSRFMCICIHTYICMHVCMYVSTHTHTRTHTHTHTHTHTYIYIYIYICIYIYIYVYRYIYTRIYIYLLINTQRTRCACLAKSGTQRVDWQRAKWSLYAYVYIYLSIYLSI